MRMETNTDRLESKERAAAIQEATWMRQEEERIRQKHLEEQLALDYALKVLADRDRANAKAESELLRIESAAVNVNVAPDPEKKTNADEVRESLTVMWNAVLAVITIVLVVGGFALLFT